MQNKIKSIIERLKGLCDYIEVRFQKIDELYIKLSDTDVDSNRNDFGGFIRFLVKEDGLCCF